MDKKIKNVVVVDDDPAFVILVKKALRNLDEDVVIHTAQSVEEGFNIILDIKADLFILDINLPKSSGLNLSNAIDKIDEKKVPTIFVSGDSKHKEYIEGLKAKKPVWFIKKPINPDNFSKIVKKCFGGDQPTSTNKKKFKLGLLKRPRPILWIATFHLLEPLFKILYLKISTGFNFETVFNTILSIESFKHFIEFWFIFPLAGLLLLSFKKIAYFLFLGIQIYIIYLHLTYESFTWPYVNESPLLFSSTLLYVNVFLIFYLSLPKVRRPFFDKSIKWWATPKRYEIKIPCSLLWEGHEVKGRTLNISRSGMFFQTNEHVGVDRDVYVKFDHQKFNFTFRASVIHERTFKGEYGVGIHFKLWQFGDYYKVIRFMQALKSLKI